MADPALITALAAIGGSLVGGLTSFATTYVTQRHQGRRERLARDLERREALYAQMIEQASQLFVDSLDKTLDSPARVVTLAATLGRIHLTSDPAVTRAADGLMDCIIQSYHRPPIAVSAVSAETQKAFAEPLRAFTQACRTERASILTAL